MASQSPPATFETVPPLTRLPGTVRDITTRDYRPWRKARFVAESLGADAIATWQFTKAFRHLLWKDLPLPRIEGGRFGFCETPTLARALHTIDRASGDDLLAQPASPFANSAMRKRIDALLRRGELIPMRMQVESAMSEATESSIIEGASATRKDALDLIRSGRQPRSMGERMILNNYEAMNLIKRRISSPLSTELLLELQSTLTAGTLDDPNSTGRLRVPGERVTVVDTRDNSTVFVPPDASHLRFLLDHICSFANAPVDDQSFVHPIVAASILHFMIGYAHPFVDGNGRTARAVFYWYTLRHGYGIFEYLSISEIIRKGFAKYPQAYLDTELDDGDLTYFVAYKLDVILQSLEKFAGHLEAEEARIAKAQQLDEVAKNLNLRQRLLLEHALRHPTTQYTVKSHMNSNGITPATSRADLQDLVTKRLMTTMKRGKEVLYVIKPSLAERLAKKTNR